MISRKLTNKGTIIHSTNDDFVHSLRKHDAPILCKGMANSWKAAEWLTFEFLSTTLGSKEVTVERRHTFPRQRMLTLAAYIEYVQTTSDEDPLYLSNWKFDDDLPLLRSHCELPDVFNSWLDIIPPCVRPHLRWLFIGPARSGTECHVDALYSSAWNALFAGRKYWTFWPPTPERPHSRKRTQMEASFVQEPGDVVVTPAGWWHEVTNLSPTVAVTENFINDLNCRVVLEYLNKVGERQWYMLIHRIREAIVKH